MKVWSGIGPSTTLVLLFLVGLLLSLCSAEKDETLGNTERTELLLQTIEGKVTIDGAESEDWLWKTTVSVDGGRYRGFLKANGEFEIHGVPPGSYLVEVVSPNDVFEPARVDISSKSGKVRARKVNVLKTTSVHHLPYPLKFKSERQANFFEKREPWSIISTLKNPMVLLLVAPMLLMLIMPRLLKNMDPEQQKEMQESMSILQPQASGMPSIEEYLTQFFGGGGGGGSASKKPSITAGTRKGRSR